jgi:hypothetical protein
MPFLHCTWDMVVGNLTRHLAMGSEDKAGDRSYIWEARRYYTRPLKKLSNWKL